MTLILFSYNVNISNVSSPSNARLWICEMRLWFRFNINKWCRFLIAFDGTFCSWFCDTSNCVSSFPTQKQTKKGRKEDTNKQWKLWMYMLEQRLAHLPLKQFWFAQTNNNRVTIKKHSNSFAHWTRSIDFLLLKCIFKPSNYNHNCRNRSIGAVSFRQLGGNE